MNSDPATDMSASTRRILKVVVWTMFFVGMVSWLVMGANRPPDPQLVENRSLGSSAPRTPIAGFGTVSFRVAGDARSYCALEAATDEARAQGMQGRRDLAGYDAMVFRFANDTTSSFINHNVPIELSLGFYDAAGRLVDHEEMAACPSGVGCPVYGASGPYRSAVETPSGGLASLGLTSPGSSISLGGACA